jgi:hypothetical protein
VGNFSGGKRERKKRFLPKAEKKREKRQGNVCRASLTSFTTKKRKGKGVEKLKGLCVGVLLLMPAQPCSRTIGNPLNILKYFFKKFFYTNFLAEILVF